MIASYSVSKIDGIAITDITPMLYIPEPVWLQCNITKPSSKCHKYTREDSAETVIISCYSYTYYLISLQKPWLVTLYFYECWPIFHCLCSGGQPPNQHRMSQICIHATHQCLWFNVGRFFSYIKDRTVQSTGLASGLSGNQGVGGMKSGVSVFSYLTVSWVQCCMLMIFRWCWVRWLRRPVFCWKCLDF